MVGDDITTPRGWLNSEERGLLTPPRTGWQYWDGTGWTSDHTLVFNYCAGEETMTRECYYYGELAGADALVDGGHGEEHGGAE